MTTTAPIAPLGLMPDWRIRQLAEAGMISPFEPGKIRRIDTVTEHRYRDKVTFCSDVPAISYGTSSYGYDFTLSANDFRIFRHVPGLIVDPKDFDQCCLVAAEPECDVMGKYFILPRHSYALGFLNEKQKLPPNVTALYIGKSTYARCGIIVNTTPGEAGWEGHLTVEISNSSGADVRIYADEGICQGLFFEGAPCGKPYGDGKYQGQAAGVTVARG
jgi:dCTP deaminase